MKPLFIAGLVLALILSLSQNGIASLEGYLSDSGQRVPSVVAVCVAPDGQHTQACGGGGGGSTKPTDASANEAAFPPTGTVLLATLPASISRADAEAVNKSTSLAYVVVDDGSDTVGTVSVLPLLPASAAGSAGGYWQNQFAKGRIRIYGATGANVVLRQD